MTIVMGIVNVTPDSFSDGGQHATTAAAVAHGRLLASHGAGDAVSRQGRDHGDDALQLLVSGGLADPGMLKMVAAMGADYVAMHWRAHSDVMQLHAGYTDVVTEVAAELAARRDAAVAAGIAGERIILDPGIGFSKDSEHNWQLLRALEVFQGLGHRLLVGASRKRFLGELLDGRPAAGRDAATAAVTTWCALHGVWAVRTHEVPAQCDAVRVGHQLTSGSVGS